MEFVLSLLQRRYFSDTQEANDGITWQIACCFYHLFLEFIMQLNTFEYMNVDWRALSQETDEYEIPLK